MEPPAELPMGLAVVGLGWFAMRAHLPALRRLERAAHAPVRVVALCTRTPSSAAAAAKALGRPVRMCTSLQQVSSHGPGLGLGLGFRFPARPPHRWRAEKRRHPTGRERMG
jgi:hypothetical protein